MSFFPFSLGLFSRPCSLSEKRKRKKSENFSPSPEQSGPLRRSPHPAALSQASRRLRQRPLPSRRGAGRLSESLLFLSLPRLVPLLPLLSKNGESLPSSSSSAAAREKGSGARAPQESPRGRPRTARVAGRRPRKEKKERQRQQRRQRRRRKSLAASTGSNGARSRARELSFQPRRRWSRRGAHSILQNARRRQPEEKKSSSKRGKKRRESSCSRGRRGRLRRGRSRLRRRAASRAPFPRRRGRKQQERSRK